jgi:tRNA(adenine34) deaminase
MGGESHDGFDAPSRGLFTKSGATIAHTLALTNVSPKGIGSGMRMLTYFINRAGRGLIPKRRAELNKAKVLVSRRMEKAKESRSGARAA